MAEDMEVMEDTEVTEDIEDLEIKGSLTAAPPPQRLRNSAD